MNREYTPREPSPLGSLVRLHDFARMEYRLQSLEAENDDLREQLRATKAELDIVVEERDRAVERLQRAGVI